MPITPKEAFELTDPALATEAREQAAMNIMCGVAANDAYLNSRSELEQIIAIARGEQVPPAHSVLNPTGATVGGSEQPAGAVSAGAPTPGQGSIGAPAATADASAPFGGAVGLPGAGVGPAASPLAAVVAASAPSVAGSPGASNMDAKAAHVADGGSATIDGTVVDDGTPEPDDSPQVAELRARIRQLEGR